MLNILSDYFGSTGFMPHGYCFLWSPSLLWVDVISDLTTATAYLSIPFALWYFVEKRPDVPFRWMFIMFGVFVLACGTTHLFAVWNIWHAEYWAEAGAKVLTAAVSAATAILIWPLMPRAISIPTTVQLENANRALRKEVTLREQAELELLAANEDLERRVALRAAELKNASNSLRESEARFRHLTEMSSDFYWETDADHRFSLLASTGDAIGVPAFQQPLRLGMRRWEISHLSPDAAGWAAHRAVHDAHQPFRNFELSRLDVDGNERFISISGNPVFDATGAFAGYRGVGTDITERRRADNARRSSEDKFTKAFYLNPDAINFNRLDNGQYVSINKGFTDIMGYTAEEIVGRSSIEFSVWDDPGDRRRLVEGLRKDGTVRNLEARFRAKDGSIRIGLMSASTVDFEGAPHILSITRDITERKQSEEALQRFSAAMDTIADAIYLVDRPSMRFVHVNAAACRMQGKTREELFALGPAGVLSTSRAELERIYDTTIAGGDAKPLEMLRTREDGSQVCVELRRHAQLTGDRWTIATIVRDITERKKIDVALRLFRHLIDQSNDAIEVIDPDTQRFVDVNEKECLDLGYSRDELLSMTIFDVDPLRDRSASAELAQALRKSGSSIIESRHRRKDGSEFPVEVSMKFIRLDRDYVLSVVRDITDRKHAEDALRANASFQSSLLNAIPIPVFYKDRNGRYIGCNAAFETFFGASEEQLIGKSVFDLNPPELAQIYHAKDLELFEGGGVQQYESQVKTTQGVLRDVIFNKAVFADGNGNVAGLIGAILDITERKKAEQNLHEAEEQFRGLVEQPITGIYIIQGYNFVYVNPRMAEILGYASAGELIGQNALSIVIENDRGTVLEKMSQRTEDNTATVNFSFIAVRKDGTTIEVGLHGTRAMHKGRPAIIGLMQDISEKRRAEDEIKRYVAQLETAFMSTVEVATTLGELRDPYTAGHQRRVAEIAVTLGAELGFDARRQEGLRVAGYLHDLGKITIPAEILSKPGKLSPIEFQLIKSHPQSGYDVLKNVTFPWPVAEVARQHHERVDGSGYPQGLKGEAIILEARIMAVADVVEAMSTHRPYRAGLGIDRTLAEIERGRGSAYDTAVADACLRLFREKGYKVPV